MSQQTCPKCSRVNPAEAMYCFNDGSPLPNHSGSNGHGPRNVGFPTPFVFPSGQSCHNYDQLALACVDNWQTARDLLQQGYLERFFGGLGRADLAIAARNAAGFPDADRGLDQLLGKLPAQSLKGPQIHVEPRQVNLGTQSVGSDSHLDLKLTNLGMGLLHGAVTVEGDCPWLAVGDAANSKQRLFQFLTEGSIPIHIRGQHLRAGTKPLEGKLTIDSNGGVSTVAVTVAVPVTPFPPGSCLAGAKTPREVASKAKSNPKDAAQQFEKGAVADWYKTNGWPYPVQGASASGIGAVQQFFEALGLTAPPKVDVSEREVHLKGNPGDPLGHTIKVFSQEKRPVFAHAVSDQSWLQVTGVKVEGNSATVRLAVRSVPYSPGETLRATVTITSNGNQKFVIPVNLGVSGRARAGSVPVLEVVEAVGPTSVPVVPLHASGGIPVVQAVSTGPARPRSSHEEVLPVVAAVATAPMRPSSSAFVESAPVTTRGGRRDGGGSGILPFLPVAFLMLGFLVTVGHDILALALGPGVITPIFTGGNPEPTSTALLLQFHDQEIDVTLGTGGVKPGEGGGVGQRPAKWEPSMRFGLTMINGAKKLTFEPQGFTNNTIVRLDGQDQIYGDRPFRALDGMPTFSGRWPGKWEQQQIPLGKTPSGRQREGKQSVWVYEDEKIYITQTVELVAGAQSNAIDTCLVRYKIENRDTRAHTVGLRFMLDTFIGENDGVPFLIPGRNELCNTDATFDGRAQIPDFIQARESDDLRNPGTICQIGLKVDRDEDRWPDRVTLGAWPNPQLQGRAPGDFRQEKTGWNVPVLSMQRIKELNPTNPADSCVTIYWDPKLINPGESREVGFTYGLGTVSGQEGGGELAITAGGDFTVGGVFNVTALIQDPRIGQTATLELPPEFTLVGGNKTENVPSAAGASRTSPVTWRVRASKAGSFPIKVTTSTGKSQTKDIRILEKGIFGN